MKDIGFFIIAYLFVGGVITGGPTYDYAKQHNGELPEFKKIVTSAVSWPVMVGVAARIAYLERNDTHKIGEQDGKD